MSRCVVTLKKPSREWMPHVWEGCALPAWCRLLVRHRFAVSPKYWYVAIIATVVTTIHSIVWLVQEIFHRHRFARTPLPRNPIFILGHWRSGTTLLHELLIRDPRHTFPTSYQCFEPNHFLITERLFNRFFWFLVPAKRPMDDMPVGWDRPQEDEFALCLLGQPSPYDHIGFPNQLFHDLDALDFRGWTARQRKSWAGALANFLRRVSFVRPGRLVLKSPPHSARIPTLMEQFPEAKFIHIVRNPYHVFPSTVRMWKALYRYHELQTSTYDRLEEYVIQCGRRLYDAVDSDQQAIPAGRFAQLRYEDLIADPMAAIEGLYRRLDLGDFAAARPLLQPLANEMGNYRSRRQLPSDADRDRVTQHWGDIVARHGYESPTSGSLHSPLAVTTSPLAVTASPLAPPHPASTLSAGRSGTT